MGIMSSSGIASCSDSRARAAAPLLDVFRTMLPGSKP